MPENGLKRTQCPIFGALIFYFEGLGLNDHQIKGQFPIRISTAHENELSTRAAALAFSLAGREVSLLFFVSLNIVPNFIMALLERKEFIKKSIS